MAEELEIPVAYCATCDDHRPVVVESFPMEDDAPTDGQFTAIYCPGCESVINLDQEIEVQWFTPDELPATGWRLSAKDD